MKYRKFFNVLGKFLYIYSGLMIIVYALSALNNAEGPHLSSFDYYYIVFALGMSMYIASFKVVKENSTEEDTP